MQNNILKLLRHRKFHPFISSTNALSVKLRNGIGIGPRLVRILLISDRMNYTSEEQFAPLRRHSRLLRTRLGVVFEQRMVDSAGINAESLAKFDLVGLKLSFRTPAVTAVAIVKKYSEALASVGKPLIYFDGDDDLCIQWPPVLDSVALYVKKHIFADQTDYAKTWIGKSNLTDHVARQNPNGHVNGDIISSGPVEAHSLISLHLGWNIALDDKIFDLSRRLGTPNQDNKDIDVATRSYVQPDLWTYPLRNPAVERIEALSSRYRVLAPRDRVAQEQYYAEMLRARICVSPFGYGELCWRDFEAILCGCLLVKPDMSHVKTHPDLFVDRVTYAAVRWDYSDLDEVCTYYLEHEDERRQVAAAAHEKLIRSLSPQSFLDDFSAMLDCVSATFPHIGTVHPA